MKLQNPILHVVDFKLAQLLKEKQFDILTELCYDKKGQMSIGTTLAYFNANKHDIYLAPTFDQLHWWLMEKGIFVSLSFFRMLQNNFVLGVGITTSVMIKQHEWKPSKSNSYPLSNLKEYEEILNKAYYEAVQLINNLNQSQTNDKG